MRVAAGPQRRIFLRQDLLLRLRLLAGRAQRVVQAAQVHGVNHFGVLRFQRGGQCVAQGGHAVGGVLQGLNAFWRGFGLAQHHHTGLGQGGAGAGPKARAAKKVHHQPQVGGTQEGGVCGLGQQRVQAAAGGVGGVQRFELGPELLKGFGRGQARFVGVGCVVQLGGLAIGTVHQRFANPAVCALRGPISRPGHALGLRV